MSEQHDAPIGRDRLILWESVIGTVLLIAGAFVLGRSSLRALGAVLLIFGIGGIAHAIGVRLGIVSLSPPRDD